MHRDNPNEIKVIMGLFVHPAVALTPAATK